jgi:DNA integrity scanning protein DisA with diadenylate cyclase activity
MGIHPIAVAEEHEHTLRVVTMVVGSCEQAIKELERVEPRFEALISQLEATRDEAMDAAASLVVGADVRPGGNSDAV